MASVAEFFQRLIAPGMCAEDRAGAPAFLVTIECERCGELIRARIDKAHELQDVYGDDDDKPIGYVLTKELVGANCPNLVRLRIDFDAQQRPRDLGVEGGKLVHMECTD